MAEALKKVKVTAVTSHIDVPKFDVKIMSVEAYLSQVETYFRGKGYDEEQYLAHIKPILSEDAKVWYNHECTEMEEWDDFKRAFKERYDGWLERERRHRQLQLRKQNENEPTEKFIYDMIDLSRNCYPEDSEQEHVRRAQMALNPHLAALIGMKLHKKATMLIRACELATGTIEAQNKLTRVPTQIPPMRSSDRKVNSQKNADNQESNGNNQHNPTTTVNRGGYRGTYRGRGQGRGRFNSRGGYNAATGSQRVDMTQNAEGPQQGSLRGRGGNSRGRLSSYKQQQRTGRLAEKDKCLKCHGYGHRSEECPNKRGISMAVLEDGTEVYLKHDEEDDDDDDLNL